MVRVVLCGVHNAVLLEVTVQQGVLLLELLHLRAQQFIVYVEFVDGLERLGHLTVGGAQLGDVLAGLCQDAALALQHTHITVSTQHFTSHTYYKIPITLTHLSTTEKSFSSFVLPSTQGRIYPL
jgi:hypothetical protein